MLSDSTSDKFKSDSLAAFPDENYDYSLVKYIDCNTKVNIICLKDEHGIFQRVPYNFLKKRLRCPKCVKEEKTLYEQQSKNDIFIEKARLVHGDKYDYSSIVYKTSKDKMIIKCIVDDHGEFSQCANSHLHGHGCPKCAVTAISASKMKDKAWFIKKAADVHGDKYDYTNSIYEGSQKYIKIECRKEGHPTFTQNANNHLQGDGCPKCANEKSSERQKLTTDEFVMKAIAIHGQLYNYTETVYSSSHESCIIYCNQCNTLFSQKAIDHLSGRGCTPCGLNRRRIAQTFTKDEFIAKANTVHNNKYIYDEVNYINSQTKVLIKCPDHGIFEQLPNSHMRGAGCVLCAIEKNSMAQRLETEDFIKRCSDIPGNSDKYDYSNTVYIKSSEKVRIDCKICLKTFYQLPTNHVHKLFGCPFCAGNAISTTDEFIIKANKIHGTTRYSYDKTIYNRSNINVLIKCNNTNLYFNQTPNSHLVGSGCSCCHPKFSKKQLAWMDYCSVSTPDIQDARHINGEHKISNSRFKADGYSLNEYKIYEFHGCYYHGCPKCFSSNAFNTLCKKTFGELYIKTQNKMSHIVDNGYNYRELWECDWSSAINAVKKLQIKWRSIPIMPKGGAGY